MGRPEIGQWKIYIFSFLIHLLIGRASKYLVLDFFVFNLLFFFVTKNYVEQANVVSSKYLEVVLPTAALFLFLCSVS